MGNTQPEGQSYDISPPPDYEQHMAKSNMKEPLINNTSTEQHTSYHPPQSPQQSYSKTNSWGDNWDCCKYCNCTWYEIKINSIPNNIH